MTSKSRFDDLPQKVRPFASMGLMVRKIGDQYVSECPFCSRDDHFYIDSKTGMYHCKVGSCDESGNPYVFLRKVHEKSWSQTPVKALRRLAEQRKLPFGILKRHRVAQSLFQDRWLIPCKNNKGKIANLYRYNPKDNSMKGVAGCNHHPYMINDMSDDQTRPLYICEGHWDAMAFEHVLLKLKMRRQVDLIAVPGATTFKKEWMTFVAHRDVRLVYDNDEAGQKGIARVARVCAGSTVKPESLSYLDWGEKPDGFDIKDLLNQ